MPNSTAALASQTDRASDLLVLDLMMPGLDGLEVCKALRARGQATPILMLTAKSTELDRVLGLELGADDYLTKPFSPRTLVAHIRAVLRRRAPQVLEDAVQVVREEMTTHSRSLLGDMSPDQLRALLGDKLDAVRQQDIEKAKAHRNATRPKPNGGRPAAGAAPKKRIHSSQLTPEQYSRLLNGEDIDV